MCQEQRYRNGNLCEAAPETQEKQRTFFFSNTTGMAGITGGESDPVCQGMCESCLLESASVLCAHICHPVPAWGYKFRLYLHTDAQSHADINCNYFNWPSFQKLLAALQRGTLLLPSPSANWFHLYSSSVKHFPCYKPQLRKDSPALESAPRPRTGRTFCNVLCPNSALPKLEWNCLAQFW